jgi:AcrR family transcriptional regulator
MEEARMTNSPGRSSSREKLLDAAVDLITQHGVHELTLEGVATAVGVTKGGLIYHFKTKDDLLEALVERMLGELQQRNRVNAAKRGDTVGALLQTLVDETFDMPSCEKLLHSNLLAAVASYPHLMAPAQRFYAEHYDKFADAGPQVGLALVIATALDGIALLELVKLHQFTPEQRDTMRAALHQLAKSLT